MWEAVEALSSLATVFVSADGLYLVRQQLIQTRNSLESSSQSAKAAAEAARTAFQQSRPWMKLSLSSYQAEIYFSPGEPDKPQISIPIRYENVGQTPALSHMVLTRGIRDPHLDNGASIRAAWEELLSKSWQPQPAVFPGDIAEGGYGAWLPWPEELERANFVVLVAALYKSSVDGPQHGTPLVVSLHGDQPTGQPLRVDSGLMSPVRLMSVYNHGTYPI